MGLIFFQNAKFCSIFNIYNSADDHCFKIGWIANLMPPCSMSYCQYSGGLKVFFQYFLGRNFPEDISRLHFAKTIEDKNNMKEKWKALWARIEANTDYITIQPFTVPQARKWVKWASAAKRASEASRTELENEWAEQANNQTDDRVAQYLHLGSGLIWPTVHT